MKVSDFVEICFEGKYLTWLLFKTNNESYWYQKRTSSTYLLFA